MRKEVKLLSFDEVRYNGYITSIRSHALKLVEAAQVINELGLPKVSPNTLLDGKFVERVLEFYKKEWSSNTAFKHVSFDKYLEFIELNYTKLEELEKEYNSMKDHSYNFYKQNDLYYSFCEHRFKEGLVDAPDKDVIKVSDLFVLKGTIVNVNLSEEYFKLYATNDRQLEKIKDIDDFVNSSRKVGANYKTIKYVLKSWISDLSYNLDSYEINYYYLLQNLR